MLRNITLGLSAILFAASVLATSIFRSTTPLYVFSQSSGLVQGSATQGVFVSGVDYYLPYPGILPDHFIWPVKVLRDKLWLFVTRDPMRKAQLLLLFADKRVGMARELIKGGKPALGVATAEKGGLYLVQAFETQLEATQDGADTGEFLEKLAKASLKHREELENMMLLAPEDAKPALVKVIDFSKTVYEKSSHSLNKKGRLVPVPLVAPSPSPQPQN